MSELGNEFSGLPMGDLIGGPLTAACDAQIRLAQATANFINTVGFVRVTEPGKPNDFTMQPRQVDFSFWRPAKKDSDKPEEGPQVEKVALSVPFLSIINIPALKIKSIDFSFDMEVKSSVSTKESESRKLAGETQASLGWGPLSVKVQVSGSVATAKENTRSTDKSAKYHVEIHALDEGMPEGLSRVLDIMQSAIAPLAVSKPRRAEGLALPGEGTAASVHS